MGWRPVALLLIDLLASACALSAVDLHNSLNLNQGSYREKLAANQELIDAFSACTAQPYDERTAAPNGRSVPDGPLKSDDPLKAIRTLIGHVKERRPAHAESLQILDDMLRDWKESSFRRLDLRKLRSVVDVITQWHLHLDFDEDALAEDGSRFAQLLLAYNTAYFGDIRYAVQSDGRSGLRAVGGLTSDGFVDRNGNVWKFPGLSLELAKGAGRRAAAGLGDVDSKRITADLVRVFLEAFFDAAFREPAVQQATALQIRWKSDVRPYPAFDADHPPIALDAFARVTRDALRAEAAVTSEVGKAVRGGSILSTQNETLAAGLETAAGVIAKKLVEHGGFCYFETVQQRERRKEGITQ